MVGAFLATAFLAVVFLAAVFLAGAFLAADLEVAPATSLVDASVATTSWVVLASSIDSDAFEAAFLATTLFVVSVFLTI